MIPLRIAVAASCIDQPLRDTLLAAADMGAEGLLFDARKQLRPTDLSETGRRQFLKLLDELNLTITALSFQSKRSFYNLDQLEGRIDATKKAMLFAFQLGAQVLTLRVGRVPEDVESQDYKILREVLDGLARYGNHVGVAPALTPCGDAPERLNQLIKDVTEGPIGIDIDPAGMVMTGHPPLVALKDLHQSILHVQARDGLRDVDGTGIEVPLGRGEIDWLEYVATLSEIDYRGWLTVTRTQGDEKREDAARAVKYLKNLLVQ